MTIFAPQQTLYRFRIPEHLPRSGAQPLSRDKYTPACEACKSDSRIGTERMLLEKAKCDVVTSNRVAARYYSSNGKKS